MNFKPTKKQQKILDGKENSTSEFTKNDDGSINIDRCIMPYEEFHELLNHLMVNAKIQLVSGRNEDFVIIKRKLKIKVQ